MEDYLIYLGMIAAGFIAGVINTMAGSGSLVTLPLLIFAGLPANVANGTNRIGVLFQNIAAVNTFHKQDKMDIKGVIYLGIPAIIGSIIGAQIAVNLDEEIIQTTIGILMIALLFFIILRPQRWLSGSLEAIEGFPKWWQFLIFIAIGFYGGFIQAGVGIFLLSGLVLSLGYDLVRANAVKVGIVLLFTVSAMIVFIANRQINYFYGFIVAIGQITGGWVGAKVTVEGGEKWVRRLLIVVIIVSSLKLTGALDLIVG
jgi:uncharacterized protein